MVGPATYRPEQWAATMSKPAWVSRLQAEVTAGMLKRDSASSSSQAKGNLSFRGNGKVSTTVKEIVGSDRVKADLIEVRELRAAVIEIDSKKPRG